MTNNTALQVTNFNFYGDELIALKDNATGEIYTSVNHVLRGIGFNSDRQIQYQRNKWNNDRSISKGVSKFVIPTSRGKQETNCISIKKLPLALAKIHITKRMEKDHPNIADKLETYQDKCADVLASAFIDRQATVKVILQPILNAINNLINAVNTAFSSLDKRMSKIEAYQEQMRKPLPRKRFSYWQSKMFPKYLLLMEYFEIPEGQNGILYKELYKELHNLYRDFAFRYTSLQLFVKKRYKLMFFIV